MILRKIKIYGFILYKKALQNLTLRLNARTFILIASIITGLVSGLGAVALKSVVHFFQNESKYILNFIGIPQLIFLLPLFGIITSVLIINTIFKGKITRGLTNIIYLIIRKKADIPGRKVFSHMLTSGATVGMGGSVGLEAPIVVIGASIGSNIAKALKLNYHQRTLLLACGSAAGISAIFNSPIAGVIFAIEVLLPEITVSTFIPLLIASASSSVLSRFIYTSELFYLATEGWHLYAIPYYIALGIICGFISVYMIKATLSIEHKLSKMKNQVLKIGIGGIGLCFMIFVLPQLFGEGYSTIISLLKGNNHIIANESIFKSLIDPKLLTIILALFIIFSKVIATSLTIGSGGNGGIIAPSLFTGAITGFILAYTLNYLGIITLNQANFIVVGMAGILSGVLHAPLTSIFLIAEITGGYVLIVPLMIVSSTSYFISKYFSKYSVYTAALALKGIDFRSEKESFSMQHLSIHNILETDFHILHPNKRLRDLVDKIQHTNRNIFPVVNDNGNLIGIVTLDDVREIMLDREIYDMVLIYEIMNTDFYTIDVGAEISDALKIFEKKKLWNIAVTDNNKYLGFISKSNLLNRYIDEWHERRAEEI